MTPTDSTREHAARVAAAHPTHSRPVGGEHIVAIGHLRTALALLDAERARVAELEAERAVAVAALHAQIFPASPKSASHPHCPARMGGACACVRLFAADEAARSKP